jgi:hypothetical protein
MTWAQLLAAGGIPDSPGREVAIVRPQPLPTPSHLTVDQPCCVWFWGGISDGPHWEPGFRIEALAPGGATVGDKHKGSGSRFYSTTLPAWRISPGPVPPAFPPAAAARGRFQS